MSYHANIASSGSLTLQTLLKGAQLTSKRKKKIFVKPFKRSILNSGVTFGCTLWQFHGPCAKDRVVVTDANVRYRNIMN